MTKEHAEAVRSLIAEKLGVDVPLKALQAAYDDVAKNEGQQIRTYGGKAITFFSAGRGFVSAAVGAIDLPDEDGETPDEGE